MSFTVRMRIDGLRDTLDAFRDLPDAADRSLRERTHELAETLAVDVRAAALADSRQSALMAPTVAARRDRVPSIVAGGSRRVGRNRVRAFKILFGSEFGATRLRQFRPHLGSGSYWFFSTVEENGAKIGRAWSAVADDIVRAFRRGAR